MENKSSQDSAGPKAKKVTLLDVANALNISKATVSLAINDSNLVADSTKQKVLSKLDEMGYVYNRRAASLSTGESRTIGVSLHDINNPYFARVCTSIEAVLGQSQRLAFLCNTNDDFERQKHFASAMHEQNADGLILCPAIGTTVESVHKLIAQGLPTVTLIRELQGAACDFVGNDDELALRIATEHLISLGHKRIAMLGGEEPTSTSRKRRAGFLAAMDTASLPVDPKLLFDVPSDPDHGAQFAKQVLAMANPPTAIACFTDMIALGALSAMVELGVRPGVDVALIGCDGILESSRFYTQLSTVRVQKSLIGRTAAELLLERLVDPKRDFQRIVTGPELVVRATCGANGGGQMLQAES